MKRFIFIVGLSLFILPMVFAGIDFSIGNRVRVLADKGFRYTSEDKFVAQGNVILVSGENTLYGNEAHIFFKDNKFFIKDEMKLVNSEFSLLGESFEFYNETKYLNLTEAIILTDNYKVVGKKASRRGDEDIILEDATYTTCKDCPNSWAFSGKKIFITPGEYVRIRGAYFLVNGVNLLYFPYFFFPIKKERESGLLFPRVSFNMNDGTFFQVPYFQTLGDNADITITPTVWGNWGVGGEIEFRKSFKNRNGFYFESKLVDDNRNDNGEFTHLSTGGFSFWSNDERLKLFFNFDMSNDYNSLRRFERFTEQEFVSSDFGAELDAAYTGANIELYLSASEKANLLQEKTHGINGSYVQVKPEIGVETGEMNLFALKDVLKVSHGYSLLYTKFEQNDLDQNEFSRNSERAILNGRFALYLGGSLFKGKLKTSHYFRLLDYKMRFDKKENYGRRELFHQLNWELKLKKSFGRTDNSNLFSRESIDVFEEFIDNSELELGNNKKLPADTKMISESFLHQLNLNINFYHLGLVTPSGSDVAMRQFHETDFRPNSNGVFDYRDSVTSFEYGVSSNSMLSSLQRTNTLEFLVVNNFYKKQMLNDGVVKSTTSHLGGFLISQGFLLENKFVQENALSRLLIEGNMSLYGWNLRLRDSYFHDTKEHLLTLTTTKEFSFLSLREELLYDSRTVPFNKILNSSIGLKLRSDLKAFYQFSYDINVSEMNYENYILRYLPHNDCWFLEFNYFTDKIQSRYSINFMLNLNEKQFKQHARL